MTADSGAHLMVFDLTQHIHLASYLRHLVHFWIQYEVPGRMSLVVWPTFLHDHADVVQLANEAPKANIQFVTLTEAERQEKIAREQSAGGISIGLQSLLQAGREHDSPLGAGSDYAALYDWELYCRYAAHLQATQGMIMYMHSYLPLLAAGATSPIPVSGIYFAPTFHYGIVVGDRTAGHGDPAVALRERFVLTRALRYANLHTLFVLDRYAVAPMHKLDGAQKSVHLVDPVQLAAVKPGAASDLRRMLEIEPERRIFLLFGHLTVRKGVAELLDAVGLLAPELCARSCVVLAGAIQPEYRDEIEQRIRDVESRSLIQLRRRYGYVGDDEMAAYFALADVVLAPYPRHAGMSGILLLAAAAGKPVLSSDYGLMGEIVRRYELGLAVDARRPDEIAAALARFVQEDPGSLCNRMQMARLVHAHEPGQFASTIYTRLGLLADSPAQSFISSVL